MTKRKHVASKALDATLLPMRRKPIPHAFVLELIGSAVLVIIGVDV